MNHKNTVLIFVISICLGCTSQKKGGNSQESHIDTNMFEHHYVTQDLPGEADWGYGCPAMADFTRTEISTMMGIRIFSPAIRKMITSFPKEHSLAGIFGRM